MSIAVPTRKFKSVTARNIHALDVPPPVRRILGKAKASEHAVAGKWHRWLISKKIPVADCKDEDVVRFLRYVDPAHSRASKVRRTALLGYLSKLYNKGLISFDPDTLRRITRRLPPLAIEFMRSLTTTLAPSSCVTMLTSMRAFHTWISRNDLVIEDLRRSDLTGWFEHLLERGLAPASRLHLHMHARKYLRWLAERGALKADPDDLVRSSDRPKLPNYLPRPLSREVDLEVQRRLSASDSPIVQGLLLMRRTGLRVGELAALEYNCIRADIDGNLYLKVPLGKLKTERLVPLDAVTAALVQRLQHEGSRRRRSLFLTEAGERPKVSAFAGAFKRRTNDLDDSGPLTTHRLRHTYATTLLNGGMSLVGVMKLLGHRDYRMTLRYAAITEDTGGREYHQALAQLETRYALPQPIPGSTEVAPSELVDDIGRWLGTHAIGRQPPGLLKRVLRLRDDLRKIEAEIGRRPRTK